MKKLIFISIILCLIGSLSAQKFYFETAAGGGVGSATNSKFGLSTGDRQFFITLQGAFSTESNATGIFISPGILAYPTNALQLSLSPGIGVVDYERRRTYWASGQWRSYTENETTTSFSLNASVAYDIGRQNGMLLGLRYFGSWGDVSTTSFGPFVGYRFNRVQRNIENGDRTTNGSARTISTPTPQLRVSNIENAMGQALSNIPARTRLATVFIASSNRNLSNTIIEDIEYYKVRNGYRVVNRSQLEDIREELGFLQTNEVDDRTAIAIGREAEADFIITGRVEAEGNNNRIRLRVLNVQSGEVAGVANVIF